MKTPQADSPRNGDPASAIGAGAGSAWDEGEIAMQRTTIEHLYGEQFYMRVSTLSMPWKKGPDYVLVELVLKYSETSHRLNGDGFWCAIDDTFDRALVKACLYIKEAID